MLKTISKCLNLFSKLFRLRPNITRCNFPGTGTTKSFKVALSGIKYYNLDNKCIKILAIYIPCNNKRQEENNFGDIMKNICKVIQRWHLRQLSQVKSKIVFLDILNNSNF